MVNNFKHIYENHIHWPSDEYIYHIQLLKRKKDGNKKSTSKIKTYILNSGNDRDQLKEKIIEKCESTGARAYINLNPKSIKQIIFKMQRLLIDYVEGQDYQAAERVFDKAAGQNYSCPNKKWIIDLDYEDISELDDKLQIIRKEINTFDSSFERNVIDMIPTAGGHHLVTHPFNLKQLANSKVLSFIKKEDVKKAPVTLLYKPDIR